MKNNIYTYGAKNQSEKYMKTTEAIGDYVGREYNKAMRTLVKKMKESKPSEPAKPEKEASDADLKEYEKKLDRYLKRSDVYDEYKAKVFVIIMGQCSLTMKNKVESLSEFEKLEEGDDVIGLLKAIRGLAFTTNKVQYEHWTTRGSMRRLLTMHQFNGENLTNFYKRFMYQVDVVESQWGKLIPTRIVRENASNDEDERKKFIACMFLGGVDRRRYGKFIDEMNNSYVSGQDTYPKSAESALTMLSHYRSESDKKRNRRAGNGEFDDGESMSSVSFAQKRKDVICYN